MCSQLDPNLAFVMCAGDLGELSDWCFVDKLSTITLLANQIKESGSHSVGANQRFETNFQFTHHLLMRVKAIQEVFQPWDQPKHTISSKPWNCAQQMFHNILFLEIEILEMRNSKTKHLSVLRNNSCLDFISSKLDKDISLRTDEL